VWFSGLVAKLHIQHIAFAIGSPDWEFLPTVHLPPLQLPFYRACVSIFVPSIAFPTSLWACLAQRLEWQVLWAGLVVGTDEYLSPAVGADEKILQELPLVVSDHFSHALVVPAGSVAGADVHVHVEDRLPLPRNVEAVVFPACQFHVLSDCKVAFVVENYDDLGMIGIGVPETMAVTGYMPQCRCRFWYCYVLQALFSDWVEHRIAADWRY
jgi:hypothetical protein